MAKSRSAQLLVDGVLTQTITLADAHHAAQGFNPTEMLNEWILRQAAERSIALSPETKRRLDLQQFTGLHPEDNGDDACPWHLWRDLGGEAGEGS